MLDNGDDECPLLSATSTNSIKVEFLMSFNTSLDKSELILSMLLF